MTESESEAHNKFIVRDEIHSSKMSLGGGSTFDNVLITTGKAGKYEGDCISNPSLCNDGLSVSFWLKQGGVYSKFNALCQE